MWALSVSHGQDVSKAICREQGEGSFKLSSSLLECGSFCSLAEDLKQKLGVSLARTARVLVPRHACCPAGRTTGTSVESRSEVPNLKAADVQEDILGEQYYVLTLF